MDPLNSSLPASDMSKPFWASQTVWSAFAVIGASAGGAVMAWKSGDMGAFGASITGILGGINAIVGRFKASSPIR